jgi:DNA-3-methyladenine glycosylase
MEEDAQINRDCRAAAGLLLARAFFEAPPDRVAPRLLGKVLASRTGNGWLAGRIVEVEAYLGPHQAPPDPAAHAYRGPTERNRVLFGPAGHAYVYSIYGRYFCMNISCEQPGKAGCVLLRALEPVAGLDQMARNRGLILNARPHELTAGPSRLCQALGLARQSHNGLDLLDPASPLQLWESDLAVDRILITSRIGIRRAAELPLRFAVADNPCLSGPKNLLGRYVALSSL